MFKKVKFMNEGYEMSLKSRTPRKLFKAALIKTLAISGLILIVLSISIIYYGIVIERIERLKQIQDLNLKHQHVSTKPLDEKTIQILSEVQVKEEKNNFPEDSTPSLSDELDLQIQHNRFHFPKRRLIRELNGIDPIQLGNSMPGIFSHPTRTRSKRTKLALLKLEDEYLRCKREELDSKDCMLLFIKMYNVAKEFSTKMEELKSTLKTKNISNETDSDSSPASKESPVIIQPESLPIKSHFKPSIISWIIDGHHDFIEEERKTTGKFQSIMTTTSRNETTFAMKENTEAPTTIALNYTTSQITSSTAKPKPGWIIQGIKPAPKSNSTQFSETTTTKISSNITNNFEIANSNISESVVLVKDFTTEATKPNLTLDVTEPLKITTSDTSSIQAVETSTGKAFQDHTNRVKNRKTNAPELLVLVEGFTTEGIKANLTSDGVKPFDSTHFVETTTTEFLTNQTTGSKISDSSNTSEPLAFLEDFTTEGINQNVTIMTHKFNSTHFVETVTTKTLSNQTIDFDITTSNTSQSLVYTKDFTTKSTNPHLISNSDNHFTASLEFTSESGFIPKDNAEDEESSSRMKFDWIIDGNDENIEDDSNVPVTKGTLKALNSTSTSTMTPITYPTKPKPEKFSWIIDGDPVSGEENRSSNVSIAKSKEVSIDLPAMMNSKALDNTKDKNQTFALPSLHKTMTLSFSEPVSDIKYAGKCQKDIEKNSENLMRNCTTAVDVEKEHPLDNPSSAENMLESEEREIHKEKHLKDFDKAKLLSGPLIVEHSLSGEVFHTLAQTTLSSTTSTTAKYRYDQKGWEEKFEKLVEHQPDDDLIETFGNLNTESLSKFGPKLNPVNLNNFEDNQFMTLCERYLAKKLRNKANIANNALSNAENETENFTQPPNNQFTSRGPGGFPVTGETMKASAQFMFNPTFGMPSIPICFYLTPANIRMANPMWQPSYFGMQGNYGGNNNFMGGAGSGGPGGIFFVPQTFGPSGNFFGHTGGSTGGAQGNLQNIFSKNASPQKQQQFFCTYMQSQNNNQNQGSGPGSQGTGGNVIGFPNANFKMRFNNQTTNTDIIYASYADVPEHLGHKDHFKCPLAGEVACYGGNQCIKESTWCDGSVDCPDGSDESACRCQDRLLSSQICDGYADCPMGEDEIGCFGCDDFMHSCYQSPEEYEQNNRSAISMCFSNLEKCDGFMNCLNGRDEQECSLIVSDLSHHMSHSVSSSEGYLFHNYRGEWFPVCNNGEKWAKEACDMEGLTQGSPNITFKSFTVSGPFIEPALHGNVLIPQTCEKRNGENSLENHISYVQCAPAKCGLTKSPKLKNRSKRSLKRKKLRRVKRNERIVGGVYTEPMQWPFIVALFRNGNFHCGGTIYSEHWIISAAHCVINHFKYYYEARAGVLRLTSFAVSTQIRPISHVIVHQMYQRRSMRNDLSLLRVEEPFTFNRWVKPICLPDIGRTTMGEDWIWGPEVNTTCTAVGWGAIREKGPGSNHLRQVVVPIRERCKEKEDQMSEDICAGDEEGGRDACQGDSGGPLFCQSVSNENEWFLAGVVSHGNGCARKQEFGVYTRVALYLDWIELGTRPEFLPKIRPVQMCPGYMCVWGGKRCIPQRKRCDRVVNCLGGEDEVGCIYNFIPDVASTKNGTTTLSDNHLKEETSTETNTNDQDTKSESFREMLLSQPVDVPSEELQATMSLENPFEIESFSTVETPVTLNLPVDIDFETEVNTKSSEDMDKTEENATLKADSITPKQTISSTSGDDMDTFNETDVNTTSKEVNKTEINITPNSTSPTTLEDMDNFNVLNVIVTGSIPTVDSSVSALKTTVPMISESSTKTTQMITSKNYTYELSSLASTTTPITSNPPSETTTSIPISTSTLTSTTDITLTTENQVNQVGFRNTTTNPITKNQPLKFVCTKMQQIIDQSRRCDRTIDCEDGSDEDDCTCRDYLKAPLDILICDGKADCEDLTDEDDCGNCKQDEFLCSLSKTCIPLTSRCDDKTDCKFKEDEKDCFALSNGKEIILDSDKKPAFTNIGVFSRNQKGDWRIVCSQETNFHTQNAKTAQEICILLGFKDVQYYNTTESIVHHHIVPIEPGLRKSHISYDHFNIDAVDSTVHFMESKQFLLPLKGPRQRSETILSSHDKCLGIYVECKTLSNKVAPLKTLSAAELIKTNTTKISKIEPEVQGHNKPNAFVLPPVETVIPETKKELLDKMDLIHPIQDNKAIVVNNQLHKAVEDLHWPWLVDIYANGKLWCLGVLLDKNWAMVHDSCLYGIRLNSNYVSALLGGGKTKDILHKSNHEQIVRIDCSEAVQNSDVLLLHFEKSIRFSHYVLPSYLPEMVSSNKNISHECLAILHDNVYGRVKTLPILEKHNNVKCNTSDISCFHFLEKEPPVQLLREPNSSVEDLFDVSEEDDILGSTDEAQNLPDTSNFPSCKQFGMNNLDSLSETLQPIDQGILVCREMTSSWFPKGLFDYNNTNCMSFSSAFNIRTLNRAMPAIQKIIDQPQCTLPHDAPKCSTWRCPLGKCLEEDQVCNGQEDCHDGSDEDKSMCTAYKQVCEPSEMKCRKSHKCIPKSKFCDHVPDCEDLSDEPTVCSCFTFLRATDPSKICDGIRNCWDKSDESPVLCNCTENHFQCSSSKECIPRDFVCDKDVDCPNGEDEKFCFGIEHPLEPNMNIKNHPKKSSFKRRPQYGQVIEQSFGLWHTKCFPKSSPPDISEVRQICLKLGYNGYQQPSYRLIDDLENEVVETFEQPDQRGRSFGTDIIAGKYRPSTKAIISSKFSMLHINDILTLFVKPSRPIAELVHWNETDSSKCYRLEIRCA